MKIYYFLELLIAAVFIVPDSRLAAAQTKAPQQVALLKIDKKYETRTVVKKSTVPGAGNGLFAAVKIKKGEVIGQLGGRLVSDDDYPKGNHYLATIPECALEKTKPYKYIDSKDYGAHVSRINFAPSKINEKDTDFQNAAIKQLCDHPYFIFVALKDIAPYRQYAIFSAGYKRSIVEKNTPIRIEILPNPPLPSARSRAQQLSINHFSCVSFCFVRHGVISRRFDGSSSARLGLRLAA